ncbi:MAG: hypothetical protein ACHQK9_07180, partial [Reyranellales bacterium]
ASRGWLHEQTLAKADYVGTIDVSVDDAKLYRAVPFDWQVTSPAGAFTGSDTAWVRIDGSGERTVLCGWLKLENQGSSVRAARWLAEARLSAGLLTVSALFIASTDQLPGGGLHAGCARLDEGVRPSADAPLSLEGRAVPE